MQVVSGLAVEKEYLAMRQLSQYKRNAFSMHTKRSNLAKEGDCMRAQSWAQAVLVALLFALFVLAVETVHRSPDHLSLLGAEQIKDRVGHLPNTCISTAGRSSPGSRDIA
jgi:hypothetical protein